MNYDYFRNKTIYDLNLKELEWIRKNSYMNEYVYYGKKYVLENKEVNLEGLRNIISDETINDCKLFFNSYMTKKTFDRGMLFAVKLNYIIDELNDEIVFNKFIYNRAALKSFCNVYIALYDVEISAMKSVLDRFGEGIRYQLWPEYMVRDESIQQEDRVIMRKGIILYENGKFEEGIKYLDKQLEEKEILVTISSLYYKMLGLIRLNKKEEVENIISTFEFLVKKYRDAINNVWNLTSLKISLFFLNAFEYTKNTKFLDNYRDFFYQAIKSINIHFSRFRFVSQKEIDITNDIKDIIYEKQFNIELIREYFLNIIAYLYIGADHE